MAEGGNRPPPAPDLDETAALVLGRALASTEAMDELRVLCDDIGHRLAGSDALDRAIAWAAAEMAADGLSVRTEPVRVPVWRRNDERLTMLSPRDQPLDLLGLGGTVATPPEGITAEVVVVDAFEDLSDAVADKIVLFDVPFTTYGETVQYRLSGADAAAAFGARAVLVRSVTPESLYTPHTGTLRYEGQAPKIPAAAVTVEDAAWLRRLADAGQRIVVRLELGAASLPDAMSANVVGERIGRERPDEIVTLGCHLDSWDVGQGAQDDGAGCVAVMEAAALLAALPVPPRRTVRAVLFTNEESGLAGGDRYAATHAHERHVALIEMDTGAGAPLGWRVDVRAETEEAQHAAREAAITTLAPLRALLAPLGATEFLPGGSGADIGPTVAAAGALGLGLHQDLSPYWRVHHTRADTLDKVDPSLLARNVATVAVTAWWLAERP